MLFSVIVTILAFGVMVILHEAGHFFVARRFGVTVHEFSIGMGPRILKWGKGETEYSLRALPLGGYVKLEGEGDESEDPKAFSNISPIKRICILVAGAAMNILLGFLCYVLINNIFGYVETTRIESIQETSYAYEAGLREGDEIIKIDSSRVHTRSDVSLCLMSNPERVVITYLRDGEKHKAEVVTTRQAGRTIIGFVPQVKKLNFLESFEYSLYDVKYVTKAVFVSLKMLFTGEAKVSDMSGPVGIVQVVDDTAEQVEKEGGGFKYLFLNLLNLFAMISVNLGIFNLLPIPALDGGSIIFAFVELVTRKKQNPNILGYINLVGLVLLLGLGVFVMFSDVMKLFN